MTQLKIAALLSIAFAAVLGAAVTVAQIPSGQSPDEEGAEPGICRPACPNRLVVGTPSTGVAGRELKVVVRDRRGLGGMRLMLCVAPPGSDWDCRPLNVPEGTARVERDVATPAPGRWLVKVRPAAKGTGLPSVRRELTVRPSGGRLKVLATGDSMIQIVDQFLGQELGGRAGVRSEAHISTGLSKPEMLDWVANARSQAGRVRPDVTVVFIGANDGFPMRTPSGSTAPCCDASWTAEYARRTRQMMQSYLRGGAGRVYWMTLPAPRGGSFRTVFGPVNAGIRRAARGLDGVHVVPIDSIFTPGFRYRDAIMRGGRWVHVRQGDGVHLNTTGASIAASEVVRRLRADRVL